LKYNIYLLIMHACVLDLAHAYLLLPGLVYINIIKPENLEIYMCNL